MSETTIHSILQQIGQIQSMERGSLHVIRKGSHGPYYNHQCYENGKHVSRYVPQSEVAQIQEAIEGFNRFQHLSEQYVRLMIEKGREQRRCGLKKKRPTSSSPKIKKSNR